MLAEAHTHETSPRRDENHSDIHEFCRGNVVDIP